MQTKQNNSLIYIAITFLAICFLASGGIFVKLSSLPPILTGFYRILFSIPILYPFVRKELKNISKKDFLLISLAGAFLALDLTFWNISFLLTTVANANLLGNLVPFTIIPISYFLYRKKLSKLFIAGLIITIFGIVLLMSGKLNPSMANFKGDFLAFLTSVFYALFLLTVADVRKRLGALTIIFVSSFGSLIILAFAGFITEGAQYPKTFHDFIPLIALTILSQILGQGLLSYCIGKIDVVLSSILVLSQPVVAALYSFIIFKEMLSVQEIIGIFIVLVGIYYAKKGFD